MDCARIPRSDEFLEGREPSDENAAQAAGLMLRAAALQEHNGYKIPLVRALIRRAVLKLAV
ncbi:MAG: hypothetical protein HY736_13955 [Verrucomicrobia bacterium]|nr:hypothetical protein [Verrucomicrobiota bacterium]